jgi:hypothetical protein
MYSNDAQILVLTVLAGGPRHGYTINADIEDLTGRKLGPGSLYGALARLEARGLVRPWTEEQEVAWLGWMTCAELHEAMRWHRFIPEGQQAFVGTSPQCSAALQVWAASFDA